MSSQHYFSNLLILRLRINELNLVLLNFFTYKFGFYFASMYLSLHGAKLKDASLITSCILLIIFMTAKVIQNMKLQRQHLFLWTQGYIYSFFTYYFFVLKFIKFILLSNYKLFTYKRCSFQ